MTPCVDPGRKAGRPLRRSILALPVIVLTLVLAACGAAACGGIGVTEDEPTSTPRPPTPTPTPDIAEIFHNFIFPIAGGCLPRSDNLMPNAPREYRGGVHEGVDFYGLDNCTTIQPGTPVLAAKDGVVLRADLDYHDLTQEELDDANARIASGEAEAFEVVDLFRGRQVWIDHGNGIVTRYAHLASVAEGIAEGARVAQGQTVGTVGDSGTPESLSNPGQETHLHWELRTGETFLGKGDAPQDVRALYLGLFQPPPR
jgi:murein DD-endopeptidase MepM/ murein hydrolase activator NlpD